METIETIARWHRETFPEATLLSQLEKFQEEKKEWLESQHITDEGLIVGDIMELADMQIVACGLARFDSVEATFAFRRVAEELGHSRYATIDLQRAVEAKMTINRERTFVKKVPNLRSHKPRFGVLPRELPLGYQKRTSE